MTYVETIGAAAQSAAAVLRRAATGEKNRLLGCIRDALTANAELILQANAQDLAAGRAAGLTESLLDRLALSPQRLASIAAAIDEIIALPDPVGTVVRGSTNANCLDVLQKRVPMGVIGIIYEARPNVTVDAAVLCLKAGNAVILRGGKEALESNKALVGVMRGALEAAGCTPDCVSLITDTAHETAGELMRCNRYLDLLIPRGGARLIQTVVDNATVPVIATGTGNCHIYVDAAADLAMAARIVHNAKCSLPSVCNAVETLLVHRAVAADFLPRCKALLDRNKVELRGDETVCGLLPDAVPATEADWAAEYIDYILAVRVVDSLDEAVAHIARWSSGHSEAIVTDSYAAAEQFCAEVDAAAVYVNASTRFTDGGVFGLGAEIGISTQKLHARGPMGLEALTTTKFIVRGSGQVRE